MNVKEMKDNLCSKIYNNAAEINDRMSYVSGAVACATTNNFLFGACIFGVYRMIIHNTNKSKPFDDVRKAHLIVAATYLAVTTFSIYKHHNGLEEKTESATVIEAPATTSTRADINPVFKLA